MVLRAALKPGLLALAVALAGTAGACSSDDDAAGRLNRRAGSSSGDPNDPNNPANQTKVPEEETKFRALEAELVANCGKTCHDTGAYPLKPPTFLAPPDVYKSIKSQPGIVVRDVFASILINKGPHAGPALNTTPELEKKVVEWLETEAAVIASQKLPTTAPFTVVNGPNEIDMSPAASGGLSGVKIKFQASIVGGMLSLAQLSLIAPAGKDTHLLQPRFVKVHAAPKQGELPEASDPADSFSNCDDTYPGGAESPLDKNGKCGSAVLFSGSAWRPFDLATDKLRIEVVKLEPGKVSTTAPAATCKNPTLFGTAVLPILRGGASLNCQNCHGGIGGLTFQSNDNALVCSQVLLRLNQGNLAQSSIITKVTQGPHQPGLVADQAAFTAAFVNNAAAFY